MRKSFLLLLIALVLLGGTAFGEDRRLSVEEFMAKVREASRAYDAGDYRRAADLIHNKENRFSEDTEIRVLEAAKAENRKDYDTAARLWRELCLIYLSRGQLLLDSTMVRFASLNRKVRDIELSRDRAQLHNDKLRAQVARLEQTKAALTAVALVACLLWLIYVWHHRGRYFKAFKQKLQKLREIV